MTARRMTAPAFAAQKGTRRLVCLTAYDVLTAGVLDEAGVDCILVGDSLGNVILGHETTLPVTLDQMISHAAAVMRARPRALVIADMPFLTFQVNPEDTLRNAGRLIQESGVDGVKLEGARGDHVRKLVQAGIPVMGHLGLTPQSVLELGGYRVQGRTPEAAEALVREAEELERAGCFSLVLESVPAPVAERVTRAVGIPTIGIGAGRVTDGQILVVTDLLGLAGTTPRFVRRYAELRETIRDAVRRYAEDVREDRFPGPEETYPE
jgi:3-methyl-2-oxobutanoate hydroxymethyltransferase